MATTGPLITSTTSDEQAQAYQRQVDDLILRQARARWKQSVEEDAALEAEMEDDMRFLNGQQWRDEDLVQRQRDRRPALTVNRLLPVHRQVCNDERQNRPAIKVRPLGDGAEGDTAKALQAYIRHIWEDSFADVAIDTAFAQAAGAGRGYFRVTTEYESEWSFQQVLKIRRIADPFSVRTARYFQPDFSDMLWAFVAEDMDRDRFMEMYEIDPMDWQGWQRSRGSDWVRRNTTRVAEYYTKEIQKMALVQLANGAVRYRPEIPMGEPQHGESPQTHAIQADILLKVIQARLARQGLVPLQAGEQAGVVQERWTHIPIVCHYKTNGHMILERSVWPGRYIPIIPVLGDELVINGEVHLSGLVRHAKDPQRMYNLWTSSQAETIGQAPRAPYIGAKGQFQNRERDWKLANVRNFAYLEYDPVDINGQVLPPPQRQQYEPPIQAVSTARLQSAEDIDATTGIYPATRGQPSNEKSGRAIELRAQQSDQSTFHYNDNLIRALRHCGRILLDGIPYIINDERVLRLIKDDGSDSKMLMAPGVQPGTRPGMDLQAQGIEGVYDFTVGEYDVMIDVGPSYHTKRQETVATMVDLVKAVPQVGAVGPDILVQNMDFQEADTLARRLKKTIPPEILEEDQARRPEEQLPIVQAQLRKTQQEAQALNAHAAQLEDEGRKVALENQQLKADRSVDQQEVQVKQQELALKAREVDIAQQEVQIKAAVELGNQQAARHKMVMDEHVSRQQGMANMTQLMQHIAQIERELAQLMKMEEAEHAAQETGDGHG